MAAYQYGADIVLLTCRTAGMGRQRPLEKAHGLDVILRKRFRIGSLLAKLKVANLRSW